MIPREDAHGAQHPKQYRLVDVSPMADPTKTAIFSATPSPHLSSRSASSAEQQETSTLVWLYGGLQRAAR